MTNPAGSAVIAPPPNSRPGAWPALGLVGLYLLVFGIACGVLARWLPFPDVPVVRDKFEHLARHGNDYDGLFLGSSRVQFQIMPSIFDREAQAGGHPMQTFNAGVAGMGSPEDQYLLEQILQGPHQRLRWVFIELSRLGTGFDREATVRFGYWHDAVRLSLIARRLWGQARERESWAGAELTWGGRARIWLETAEIIAGHARNWLTRATNLGRMTGALSGRWRNPGGKELPERNLGDQRDGWVSAGRTRQVMTPEARARYDRDYAQHLQAPPVQDVGDPVSQEALARVVGTIRRAGAVPILLIPPTTFTRNFYPSPDLAPQVVVFDFTDPRRYPALFLPENRIDVDHVNTAGAEVYSQELAHRFLTWIEETKAQR